MDELREKLAELEHIQWTSWLKYMLNNLTKQNITRWKNQANTDYKNLTEKEKQSDRKWADEVLKIIKK